LTAAFLLVLAAGLGVRLWLSARQERCVRAHRAEVPAPFRGLVPEEAHAKAADYTIARVRFGRVAAVWHAALLVALTLGGGLALLDRAWNARGLLAGTAFVLSAFAALELGSLPLRIWRTFRIEQRFGFNRTTPGLFLADLVREAALGVLLGGPLVLGALWLVRDGGPRWWLPAWAGWVGVSLLLTWAWPAVIAPLFNRFTPLRDEELERRIAALLERTGFTSRGVFVMDGSRRSSHANAYFTGLGHRKRIVLFDTLRTMLAPPELEAVLAHELGHYRLHHIPVRLAVGALTSLAGLALLAWLLGRPWFFAGLGVPHPSAHAGLVLFALVGPLFLFPLRPLLGWWSRRHEYQADAFAAEVSDGEALARALVRLYEHNASTLTPDPLHSAFFDSHPPAPLRLARLRARPGG